MFWYIDIKTLYFCEKNIFIISNFHANYFSTNIQNVGTEIKWVDDITGWQLTLNGT